MACDRGIGVDVQSAAALFHLLDSDHNGMVDRGEFLRHIFPDECLGCTEALGCWDGEVKFELGKVSRWPLR